MRLATYIVRSAAGTRLVGCPEDDIEALLAPGETAALATETDLAEHRENMRKIISDAIAAGKAAAEPDERDVLLEALKTKHGITAADLAAARTKLKGGKGSPA